MKEKVLKQLKERRLIIAVFVLFFLLNAVILYNTFSEKTTSTIWDGTVAKKFADGDGSIKNPYIINNGSELAYFFTLINSEESVQYYDKSYEIKNNINLDGHDFSFAKFNKPFSGVLNGNGFTISNFEINNYYLNDVGDEVTFSLFDSLSNANVRNINFSDITINVDNIKEENKELVEPIKEETKNNDGNNENPETDDVKTQEETNDDNLKEEKNDDNETGEKTAEDEIKAQEKEKTQEELNDDNVEGNNADSEPIAMLLADDIKLENANEDTTYTNDEEKAENNGSSDEEIASIKNEEPTKDPGIIDETEEPKEPSIADEAEEPAETNKKDDEIPNNITNSESDNDVSEKTDSIEDNTDIETVKDDNNESQTNEPVKEDNAPEDIPGEIKEEKIEITKVNVALISSVDHSTIKNISINNVKINTKDIGKDIYSTIFILNDNQENVIRNISISGSESTLLSPLLIGNYGGSTIENIIYNTTTLPLMGDYDIKDSDTMYKYRVNNENKIEFNNNYSTKAMLDLLNDGSDIKWKIQDNVFKLQNNGKNESSPKRGAKALRANAPSAHNSGTEGTVVYINEYESDANYYDGLNYTYSSDGTLPTTTKKNIYNDSNLVYIETHYYGRDYQNRYTGVLSASENHNQFVYYKVYPINDNGTSSNTSDDYVEFDLIDNPYSKNPNNRVFQGWLTDYNGAVISLDTDIYVRSVKIPITYNGTTPENININFYAIWGVGAITTYSSSWSNTFSYLEDDGFHAISAVIYTYDITGFYVYSNIRNNNNYPAGAVDANGNPLTGRCSAGLFGRCYFYEPATGTYNSNTDYYKLVNGTMTISTVPSTLSYTSEIPVGESTAGYYRTINIPRNGSLVGYFDSDGDVMTSGTCNTNGGCNYYELIQFYDINNNPEVYTNGDILYYKTTRDTNIVVMGGNITGTWGSSQNKPFTFTAVQGNTNNISSYYWDARELRILAYNDTKIENMRIRGVDRIDDDTSPQVRGGSRYNYYTTPAYDSMYCNYYNCKIGRNITSYNNTTVSFDYVIGGNMSSVSSSNMARYTFIVESGIYNNLGLTTTGANANYLSSFTQYVDAYGTFGNDYDKVTETTPATSSKLDVMYCLSGSWFGDIKGTNITTPMLHTLVKSGRYGSNKADYAAGIYVGGRGNGSHTSPRFAIVEGGWIYNLIGGPLSTSNISSYNDSYINMKGGYVDVIIGGAGRSETYGNRIIQVTGGRVNYAVFGGSNGIEGDDTQYTSTVDGDSYVYIGGKAVIGDPDIASGTLEANSQVEAGSVFGIGNGREGYSSIGTVNNSNVIIDGEATINKNVYGGGNHGATGQKGTNQTYATNIIIHGGEIKGSVYGGGNNNGAGTDRNTCNITITIDDGTVDGSVYGGSRTKGRIYGSSTVNIQAGTVKTDVYGGGEGGYQDATNYGTFVNNNISVNIGTSSTGPTINGSVYGGSAYGTVNAVATNPAANNKTVNVTVNNGTITDSVFGGAKGSSTYTPYVPGQITVDINGGTIGSVFGGFDEAGKPAKDPLVYIDGGTITNVYGGGNKTSVDNTHIYMRGGSVTTMYGGSNQSGTVLTTTIDVTGGSTSTIFGGNNQGGTCNATTVNINGGAVTSAVYGGGNLVSTGTTTVNIRNATNTIPNVYGGGNQAGATTTNVNLISQSGSNNINVTNVYGGSNQSGLVTTSNVTIGKGTVTNVYGGGNSVGVTTTHVTINNGTITNAYGGSNTTGDVGTSNLVINGGTTTTAYGANNAGGTTTAANVTLTGGTATTIFGGGNEAPATNTFVTVNNGTTNLIYGGGNKAAVTEATHVTVNNATNTIGAVYGGGNQAGAVTTNVNITPSNNNLHVTSVFGGSNQSGTVSTSNVTVNHGTITSLYGGNNAGGSTTTTNVTVTTGVITDVYGGGNNAASGDTNVEITTGTITNVYGGGNQAAVTSATTVVNGGTINTLYGGGNAANVNGNVDVDLLGGSVTGNLYGGGNQGVVTGNTSVEIDNASVGASVFAGGNGSTATVSGSTGLTITDGTIGGDVYGGGNNGAVTGSTSVTIDSSALSGSVFAGGKGTTASVGVNTGLTITDSTVAVDVYGGGNNGTVGGNTNIIIDNVPVTGSVFAGGNGSSATVSGTTELQIIDGSVSHDVYGGGNNGTVGGNTSITIDGTAIYGSVFAGGNGLSATVTGSTELTITDGTLAHDVYGGGNNGTVGTNTSVIINGTTTIDGSVYAAGNGTSAAVNGSTELKMDGITVGGSIYGGGNNGIVLGSTDVMINDSTLGTSAYAGGNGATAKVLGNTSIIVGGTTEVGTSSCTLLSSCSVFGGGNAAETGTQSADNSVASVKIAGAIIHGNVYGGANTSKVYGETDVNIGNDVTLVNGISSGDIVISGTVFGGGEANASGSDVYDWTFISVTQGINVNINGANRNQFTISGSIFGSGNASTAAGDSTVTIKNYGTFNDPKRNVSIQRTNLLVIDNSSIVLEGATDRENEYSDVLFTLSRIDELDLKNNSTLFLETGANLLKEFKSLTSNGSLAAVQIDTEHGTVTKNVDNRVYMFADKKLNIAKNQSATDYGEVSGMSFFGMYKYNGNGTINTGIYNKYNYDDVLDWGGVFDNVSSYVLGLHKTNHDIEVDGFYTNYIDEETSKNKINYIEPIPPVGQMYMWTIGEGVIEYEVDLSASKYSTLGTTELSLRDFTEPNTSFQILGFDYSELASGIQLVEKTSINKIANTTNDADTIMGLSMETSNSGWLTNGYTSFLSRANNNIIGTREYVGGNSTSTPTVLFYLHHSKNIGTSGDMGRVRIQLMSVRQIDALTKETKRLIVTVNLTRTLFDTVNYEGALTPGRKYDLFTSTTANITSSSAISTYYSLFNSGSTIYRTGYYRTLVSNYVLPLNTKITMIDLSKNTPEYYYHIITQSDVNAATTELSTNNEVTYNFSMFEVMGAINSGVYYSDASKNSEYCTTNNYCNEDFIFIIDFGDTNITSDALNNELLIEIRNATNDTIYSVLAPQHLDLVYNIYANKDAVIDIDGELDKDKIYAGESFTADLNIEYTQSTVGSATIYDTHYFDSKLGIKISLINEDGNVVPGITLLGLYYTIGEDRYYPNIDGTTRVKIADKVDSAEKWIIVNTGTSSLASGDYKLRVETFGSPDGIYYGLNSSDYIDFDIEIVNEIYGLNIETSAEEMMIDAETGLNTNGVNTIVYNVRYNSGLTNPKINFKMYRRNYDEVYDTTYTLVDALDYFDTVLFQGYDTNEYVFLSDPTDNAQVTFTLKDNLLTGTYKIEFILYGDTSVIGTLERYIIIK